MPGKISCYSKPWKQAASNWAGPEVGVAITNYIQVRKWEWQMLTIMLLLTFDNMIDRSLLALELSFSLAFELLLTCLLQLFRYCIAARNPLSTPCEPISTHQLLLIVATPTKFWKFLAQTGPTGLLPTVLSNDGEKESEQLLVVRSWIHFLLPNVSVLRLS